MSPPPPPPPPDFGGKVHLKQRYKLVSPNSLHTGINIAAGGPDVAQFFQEELPRYS